MLIPVGHPVYIAGGRELSFVELFRKAVCCFPGTRVHEGPRVLIFRTRLYLTDIFCIVLHCRIPTMSIIFIIKQKLL